MMLPWWKNDEDYGFTKVEVGDEFTYYGARMKVVDFLRPLVVVTMDGRSVWPIVRCHYLNDKNRLRSNDFHCEVVAYAIHLEREAKKQKSAEELLGATGRIKAMKGQVK